MTHQTTFRATRPGGQSMRHSENLQSFLAIRAQEGFATDFRVGHWLRSLSRAELQDLMHVGEEVVYAQPSTQTRAVSADFVQVCLLALATESARRVVKISDEALATLLFATTFEFLARDGLLTMKDVMALDPTAPMPRITMTDRGIAAGIGFASEELRNAGRQ